MLQALTDLWTHCTTHLFLLLFIFLWAKWLLKAIISTRYRPYQLQGDEEILAAAMERLAVIIPVLGEDPTLFREVVKRVLAEGPGRLVVVINGPRNHDLEHACNELEVNWIFTPQPGKRHALKLGVSWIQKECPEYTHVAFIDSDTLVTPGSLSELVKAFLADPMVGGVCGKQMIHNPAKSFLARFGDWIEDYYQASYWPALSLLGQVGCLWGRCAVFRREVIVEAMKDFLDQRVLGTRIEAADDRYITAVALKMGYKTVFQSTSLVYTAAQQSLKKVMQQQLRWHCGDQACNLTQLGWLWRKKTPLAALLTADLLVPFFFLAAFVNAVSNIVSGRFMIHVFVVTALFYFGLANLPRLKKEKQDILPLPVFILMVGFLILPIQVWGLATCAFDREWMTRKSERLHANAGKKQWLSMVPLVLAISLTIGSVAFGYLTSISGKADLEQYTVVGVLLSKEVKNKEGKTLFAYGVQNEEGRFFLIRPRSRKAEQYVGRKLRIVGEGTERTNKKGVKVVRLHKIISVEVVE